MFITTAAVTSPVLILLSVLLLQNTAVLLCALHQAPTAKKALTGACVTHLTPVIRLRQFVIFCCLFNDVAGNSGYLQLRMVRGKGKMIPLHARCGPKGG